MKKIIKTFLCMFLWMTLNGCKPSTETLDYNKKYETKQMNLELRSKQLVDQVNPVNQNENFSYRYPIKEHMKILDVQFYAENKTDQEINVVDFLIGELKINNQAVESEVCIETDHYTVVNAKTLLAPHQKTIVHVLFYLNQEEVNALSSQVKPLIYIGNRAYVAPHEEVIAHTKRLEKDKQIAFEKFDLKIKKETISNKISALHPSVNSSESYILDDPNQEYVGIFVEIINKTDEALNLFDEIALYVGAENEKIVPAWLSVLSEDQGKFEKLKQIPENNKRMVLIFKAFNKDIASSYTFYFIIDGQIYAYSLSN